MKRNRCMLPICLAVVLFAPGISSALELRLTVKDDAGVQRKPGTVTSGIPFGKGVVKDVSGLSVSENGRILSAQFVETVRWDDGSVRWALMDVQAEVPASGKTDLMLRDDGRNKPPVHRVQVIDRPASIRVSTGRLEFVVDKKHFNLLQSLKIDTVERVTQKGGGLVLYQAGGGTVTAGPPDETRIEHAGPMRAVIMLRGRFPGVHNGLLGYTVRMTVFAGRKFVKLRAWLENHGAHGYTTRENKPPYKPEWFAFDGLALELGLGKFDKVSCEGMEGPGPFKVLQICRNAPVYTEPAYHFDAFEYRVTRGGEELKKGLRTDGVVQLSGSGGTLTTAIRHFWQNYEKAIEFDGDRLKLWLWPLEGQYPRAFFDHACPGYAESMIQPLRKEGLYNVPGSVHKGYEMILDFSGREPEETHAELARPLFALAPATYYASTEAAPGLFTPPDVHTDDDECNDKLDAWTCMTRSVADPKSTSSIWHARRDRKERGNHFSFGYWYGWMDFGDLAVPGFGTVSLHYDWPWVMLVNTLRTGDHNFLRLADEMMRHRTEVDQQWSDRDLPQYRGFQRAGNTYTHFHCRRFSGYQPNVTDTWLPGIVLHYMMTGDPKALECARRVSGAIMPTLEGMLASRDYYVQKKRGDMQMAGRAIFACCAMFDLTAEKAWLDKAQKIFNHLVVPKWDRYGPHLHERKQIRSQDYIRDDIKYCYSIQAFCELHHRTGNEKVLELLKAGCDEDFPENFFDAPLFLANLNAYVARVTGEEDYIDQAVEFWIEGFPESRCPPVYATGNSQWSRRKAMMFRTGHLLQYYYWKKK